MDNVDILGNRIFNFRNDTFWGYSTVFQPNFFYRLVSVSSMIRSTRLKDMVPLILELFVHNRKVKKSFHHQLTSSCPTRYVSFLLSHLSAVISLLSYPSILWPTSTPITFNITFLCVSETRLLFLLLGKLHQIWKCTKRASMRHNFILSSHWFFYQRQLILFRIHREETS